MPYPPSKRRARVQDPNADAVAREQATLEEHVAGASAATPAAPNSYADRVKPVTDEVDAQIVKDRGPKHSRA